MEHIILPKYWNIVFFWRRVPADFRVFFTIEKTQFYGYLFSIMEVLSFPIIPPVTNNSKDKFPNDKISLVLSLSPH